MQKFLVLLAVIFLSATQAGAQAVIDCQAGFSNNPDDRLQGVVHISAINAGGWGFQSSGGEPVVPGGVQIPLAGEYDFPFQLTAQHYDDVLNVIGPPGGICYIYNIVVIPPYPNGITQADKDKAANVRDWLKWWGKWGEVGFVGACAAVTEGWMSLFCAASGFTLNRIINDHVEEQDQIARDPCNSPQPNTQYPYLDYWGLVAQYNGGDCDNWLCEYMSEQGAATRYYWDKALLNSYACRAEDAQLALNDAHQYENNLAWAVGYFRDNYTMGSDDLYQALNQINAIYYYDANY